MIVSLRVRRTDVPARGAYWRHDKADCLCIGPAGCGWGIEMSVADGGGYRHADEILRDPRGYLTRARQERSEEAHEWVTGEINRRFETRRPTLLDNLTKALVRIAIVGAVASALIAAIGIFYGTPGVMLLLFR